MPQQEWGTIVQQNKDKLQRHNLVVYLHGDFNSYFTGRNIPPVKEPGINDTGALSQISLSDADKNRTIVPSNSGRHLIVAGDADFLSEQNAAPGNVAFILNAVDWLSLDENLIGIRSRSLVDRTIQNDQLKGGSALPNIIRIINIILMPVVLVIIGLILFLRRRETHDSKPTSPKAPESTDSNQVK